MKADREVMDQDIDGTPVNYGLVLRLDVDEIPRLKEYLAQHEIRIIYQLKAIEKIRVVREGDQTGSM